MRIPAFKLMALAAPESSDAELLSRFATGRDEAAFEELLRRHGPKVHRVCRRLVGQASADDAFQAVFLVLACRAKAVRKAASVGSWLIGVAGRVGCQMRQQLRKKQYANLGDQDDIADLSRSSTDSQLVFPELASALDEELTRLPDALRAPVVLCLVEGRTQEEAAAELGGSLRTVRRRLERAKALLRLRLERRGIVPAVIAALIGSLQTTSAVPPELVRRTARGVFEFLAGGPGVKAAPAAIAKGVLANMSAFKALVFVPVAACVLVGIGVVWSQDNKPGKGEPDPFVQSPPAKGNDPFNPEKEKKVPVEETVVNKVDENHHQTANFKVFAPTPTMARALAAEAEYQRAELAKLWLGKELPRWEKPCEITYTPSTGSSGGATAFDLDPRKEGSPPISDYPFPVKLPPHQPTSIRTELKGEFLDCLTNTLPRNVMSMVITSSFGKALPRWADSGLNQMAESTSAQAETDIRCRDLLNAGRGIRLKKLLVMKEFPRDMIVLHAQGHSVVRFLLAQKPVVDKRVLNEIGALENVPNEQWQFMLFLRLGMKQNTLESWNSAARTVYGYEDVDELEETWLRFLKKTESVIKPSKKQPEPAPKPKDTDNIPPTTLPGVQPATVRP